MFGWYVFGAPVIPPNPRCLRKPRENNQKQQPRTPRILQFPMPRQPKVRDVRDAREEAEGSVPWTECRTTPGLAPSNKNPWLSWWKILVEQGGVGKRVIHRLQSAAPVLGDMDMFVLREGSNKSPTKNCNSKRFLCFLRGKQLNIPTSSGKTGNGWVSDR